MVLSPHIHWMSSTWLAQASTASIQFTDPVLNSETLWDVLNDYFRSSCCFKILWDCPKQWMYLHVQVLLWREIIMGLEPVAWQSNSRHCDVNWILFNYFNLMLIWFNHLIMFNQRHIIHIINIIFQAIEQSNWGNFPCFAFGRHQSMASFRFRSWNERPKWQSQLCPGVNSGFLACGT